jgi:hypothetical protein
MTAHYRNPTIECEPLPVDVVLHPSWWHANAGIDFDGDGDLHGLWNTCSEHYMTPFTGGYTIADFGLSQSSSVANQIYPFGIRGGAATVTSSAGVSASSRGLLGRNAHPVPTPLAFKPWFGENTLEANLKASRSPRILHIATHGFFLEDQPHDPHQKLRGFRPIGPKGFTETGMTTGTGLENPLLRSGLALAGANTAQQGGTLPPEAEVDQAGHHEGEDGVARAELQRRPRRQAQRHEAVGAVHGHCRAFHEDTLAVIGSIRAGDRRAVRDDSVELGRRR